MYSKTPSRICLDNPKNLTYEAEKTFYDRKIQKFQFWGTYYTRALNLYNLQQPLTHSHI